MASNTSWAKSVGILFRGLSLRMLFTGNELYLEQAVTAENMCCVDILIWVNIIHLLSHWK